MKYAIDDSAVEVRDDRTTVTTGSLVTCFAGYSRAAAGQIAALHSVVLAGHARIDTYIAELAKQADDNQAANKRADEAERELAAVHNNYAALVQLVREQLGYTWHPESRVLQHEGREG